MTMTDNEIHSYGLFPQVTTSPVGKETPRVIAHIPHFPSSCMPSAVGEEIPLAKAHISPQNEQGDDPHPNIPATASFRFPSCPD